MYVQEKHGIMANIPRYGDRIRVYITVVCVSTSCTLNQYLIMKSNIVLFINITIKMISADHCLTLCARQCSSGSACTSVQYNPRHTLSANISLMPINPVL